jgi:hypothetical protein
LGQTTGFDEEYTVSQGGFPALPGFAYSGTVIVGEYEVLRGKADGFHLELMELFNRS